jgi:colanic acid biosynthesis glycosyl transferase WcaI
MAPGRAATSVPSKVIGYLAAGRPVIAAVDSPSDTAHCVAESGGWVVPPQDPQALAGAIEAAAADLTDLRRRGASAREYFDCHYALPTVLGLYDAALQSVLQRAPDRRRH